MGRASEVRAIKKSKTNAAKSRIYSKYGKLIYKVAKKNPDPKSNLDLASIIKDAKRNQITKQIIDKAIKKATENNNIDYKNLIFEGFISKNAYIIIEASTDNINRTYPEIKSAFTKSETKIATPGSVTIHFAKKSLIHINKLSEDQIYEIALENEIEIDSLQKTQTNLIILAPVSQFKLIHEIFDSYIIKSSIQMIPINGEVELNNDEKLKYLKLISLLDQCSDIDDIFTNIKGE